MDKARIQRMFKRTFYSEFDYQSNWSFIFLSALKDNTFNYGIHNIDLYSYIMESAESILKRYPTECATFASIANANSMQKITDAAMAVIIFLNYNYYTKSFMINKGCIEPAYVYLNTIELLREIGD